MAVVSFSSTDYSDNRTLDGTGVDRVEFNQTCNSIMLLFRAGVGATFTFIFNENETKGEGEHNPLMVNAGTVVTVGEYPIRSITVRGTAGDEWGYMSLVKPGAGFGFAEAV